MKRSKKLGTTIGALGIVGLLAGCSAGKVGSVSNNTATSNASVLTYLSNTTITSISSNATNSSSVVDNTKSKAIIHTMDNALKQNGWKPLQTGVMSQNIKLPSTFTVHIGQYPIGMYWGYHNVLSKAVGLNISPYLGQEVTVYMIPLQHNSYSQRGRTSYGIMVVRQNKIIGAWINDGINLSDISISLNQRYFPNLVHETFGQWLIHANIVNYAQVKQQLRWSPEKVIQLYFSDINQGDLSGAYSFMSMWAQYQYFSLNVPKGHLYSSGFDPNGDGLANIKSAHVISIGTKRPFPPGALSASDKRAFNRKPYKTKQITVTVDETFRKIITQNNGQRTLTVSLSKDTKNSPWRIDSMGYG